MGRTSLWLTVLLAWLPAAEALGQQNVYALTPQSAAVQLPTFSFFGVGTTVSVPDRGRTYLGGINRAADGMSQFGAPLMPFGNRAFGSERSAANTSVSVYVHDFEAMDEYLLSQPTAFNSGARPRVPDAWQQRFDAAQAGTAAPPAASLEQLRAQHAREEQARSDEAVALYARAQTAERDGKIGVARVYYQMAVRRATGNLKAEIAARLASLAGPTSTKLAHDK